MAPMRQQSNILDILGEGNRIAVTDPVYPVVVESNVMAGRTGEPTRRGVTPGLTLSADHRAKRLSAQPLPEGAVESDLSLFSPTIPPVQWPAASSSNAWSTTPWPNQRLILSNAAYEAFIVTRNCPIRSYEIEGAKRCAIEFRSFSKNAGFHGTPLRARRWCHGGLMGVGADGQEVELWEPLEPARQSTKFNGVSYIVQAGAEKRCIPSEGQAR